MNRSSLLGVVATVVFGSMIVGCGDPGPTSTDSTEPSSVAPGSDPDVPQATDPTSATTDGQAGFGDPVWFDGELPVTVERPLTGTVHQDDNGCWVVEMGGERVTLALPPGFGTPSEDTTRVVGPDGFAIADGTAIDGTGEIVWIPDTGELADGRWGNIVRFCSPSASAVATFTSVTPAYDPTRVDMSTLVESLRSADFTEAWPCGYGFAVSTDDQRIGLLLYATEAPSATATVTLPDPAWNATVIVGKDLFIQHCDDVVEVFEPPSIVAAEWPLTAGSFELTVPVDVAGCGSNAVESQLVGAVVDTPDGDVSLPSISLGNEAWGCFAG